MKKNLILILSMICIGWTSFATDQLVTPQSAFDLVMNSKMELVEISRTPGAIAFDCKFESDDFDLVLNYCPFVGEDPLYAKENHPDENYYKNRLQYLIDLEERLIGGEIYFKSGLEKGSSLHFYFEMDPVKGILLGPDGDDDQNYFILEFVYKMKNGIECYASTDPNTTVNQAICLNNALDEFNDPNMLEWKSRALMWVDQPGTPEFKQGKIFLMDLYSRLRKAIKRHDYTTPDRLPLPKSY